MKYLNNYLLILFLIISNTLFSQNYIGENITIVKKQIKQSLVKNGFIIIKQGNNHNFKQNKVTGEWNVPAKDFFEILLSQEIKIEIQWNEFNNVTNIGAFSNNEKQITKLKKIFNSNKWKYIKTEFGEDIYVYENSLISFGGPYNKYKYGLQIIAND